LPELASREVAGYDGLAQRPWQPTAAPRLRNRAGLPASIGTLDLDRQIEEFRDAASRLLGFNDIARFAEPEMTEDLVKNFTLRAQLASGPSPTVPGLAAVTLLQASF
jgi:hypothetical protein